MNKYLSAGVLCVMAVMCSTAAAAEWTNVTNNVGGEKWGYAGVCLVAAIPDSPAMIAGVSEAGLWRSDDKAQLRASSAPTTRSRFATGRT